MKNLVRALIGLFVLLICVEASADVEITRSEVIRGCEKYTMCAAQTATGDCTALPASGEERVLRTLGKGSKLSFYSTQSVGDHICDVMSNDTGHDVLSGVGQKINAASLTESAMTLTLYGVFDYIWVTCPTIVTSATVTVSICAGNN